MAPLGLCTYFPETRLQLSSQPLIISRQLSRGAFIAQKKDYNIWSACLLPIPMDFSQIALIHLKIPHSSLSESHVSLSIIFINKTVKTCEGLRFYSIC